MALTLATSRLDVRPRHIVTIGAVVAGAAVVLSLSASRSTEPLASRPVRIDREDLTRLLRERGMSVQAVNDVRRNPSADELFVFVSQGNANAQQMVRITTNGIVAVASPGRRVFPAADGHFAAWLAEDGSAVVFGDGQRISLPRFASFDVDPSGRYFIVGDAPSGSSIGTTKFPQKYQKIADDVFAYTVFARSNTIYVCGCTDIRSRSGQPVRAAVCLEVAEHTNQFSVTRRHTIDWSDGILDVDPYSHRLLLLNKSEWFTVAYTFDLTTGKRKRIGLAKDFELFLRTNPISKNR